MPFSLIEYFPDAKGDGLCVTWAHAVNSKAKLDAALRGPAMMLEADVSMACNSPYPLPVMAQPPDSASDMTLEEWLYTAVCHNNKGIKLDFKCTEVVEPACRILDKIAVKFNGPIILNADILPGPGNPSNLPIDLWTFLILCRARFPNSILSIGWTAEVISDSSQKLGYTEEMIDRMIGLVKEYRLTQPVMFPVCASHLKYSVPEIESLLFQVPNGSLTVWTAKGHPINIDDLLAIRKAFHISYVFYDLPNELINDFICMAYDKK